jgi:hypothetical protein
MTTTVRMARCSSCKKERPSDPERMFLFEDRSPGTCDDVCKHCRYKQVAHQEDRLGAPPMIDETGQRTRCPGFESMTEGYETDTYYCGCRGWD